MAAEKAAVLTMRSEFAASRDALDAVVDKFAEIVEASNLASIKHKIKTAPSLEPIIAPLNAVAAAIKKSKK